VYFSFGDRLESTGNLPTDQLFTGQRRDIATTGSELYYYGARYYDPTIGRFISADSIVPKPGNPQSFNRYSYCLNNPLKYIDPSGHDEIPSYEPPPDNYEPPCNPDGSPRNGGSNPSLPIAPHLIQSPYYQSWQSWAAEVGIMTTEGGIGGAGIALGEYLTSIAPELIYAAFLGTFIWAVGKNIHDYHGAYADLSVYLAKTADQALGKPTEKDGYIPPKKWNGEKVKNPNGSGSGYPDRKGNVWIPNDHGGTHAPHWDVEFPGGGYRPVYPK
jgi:RHS repeat-associated protein